MNPLFFVTNARPSFAHADEVDCGRVYVGNDGQRICWHTKAQSFAYVHDLSLTKFMVWLFLPTQINKPCSPFVFGVLRQSNPFKIFWPVVSFNTVDVVDRKMRLVSMHKAHSNQTMDKNFRSFPILQCGHNQVSVFAQKRRKFYRGQVACKRLLNTISNAFSGACSSFVPNASVFVNKPRSVFFNYFYWIHSVNIIAGHL
jgi:hypothetical protein